MRNPGPHRSHAELERLLDGRPRQAGALSELLTAARAPAGRTDTTGLDAAVSAFAGGAPALAYPTRRSSMMTNLTARMRAAKLLTLGGVAVAMSAGGVALAASTGHLANPLGQSTHAAPAASAHVPSEHPSNGSKAGHSSDAPSHPVATPSPSLVGLCHSWLARPHLAGKADTNPAFTVLVTAANGTDAVNGYCTALLATSAPSGTHPSPGHATGRPSDAPGNPSHPAGKPASHPTGP